MLPSTSGINQAQIRSAIDALPGGGPTRGEAGIQVAYDIAAQNSIKDGVNRVILATDNQSVHAAGGEEQLVEQFEGKRKSDVPLTVLSLGTDNSKDAEPAKVATRGNVRYAPIDSRQAVYRAFVQELGSTLNVVAKDVAIEVVFNPAAVDQFRLIGCTENLSAPPQAAQGQADRAGEITAGHYVSALYEIVPHRENAAAALFTVRVSYKKPNEAANRVIERTLVDSNTDSGGASSDLKFAAAVAGFGMLLRDSPYKGNLTYASVLEMAESTLADDPAGYRREFAALVRQAKKLAGQ